MPLRRLAGWALLLALPASASAGAAGCAIDVPITEFSSRLDEATNAFTSLEAERFQGAIRSIEQGMACLSTVPDPALVSRAHGLLGVAAYAAGDERGAARAFAAARAADPKSTLAPGLFGQGHEVYLLYVSINLLQLDFDPVEPPAAGTIYIDGHPEGRRSESLPTLFTWRDDDSGTIIFADYLDAQEPLPAYPPRLHVPETTSSQQERPSQRDRPDNPSARRTVALTAVGVGVLSGGLYGLASLSKAELQSPQLDWTDDNLQGIQQRTNGLAVGAAVTGIAAVVLGGIAIGGSF